ncbi:hypothetical protein OTU49_005969 [Cherax quadricarinatus]|uniref:Seryl-tRNA synthetase n=1 Tax=Cherax quadricarinatus TaxID=27406 RepID=A0AAW0YLP3_CHEQU|nr:serine--tRNA synthetase-like protein Slimp [Cherax quadricarinatus]
MVYYIKILKTLGSVCQLQRTNILFYMKRGIFFSQSKKLPENTTLTAALYVPGNKATNVDGFLSPYLDFSQQFESLSDLEFNIRQRGLSINVRHIVSKWKEWKELEHQQQQLEEKREIIAKKIKTLKNKSGSKEMVSELKQCGKKIREQVKDLSAHIWDLEETAVIAALQLPNYLHHTTGLDNKQIFNLSDKPSFTYQPKDHVQLGESAGELVFLNNSPTAYYLKNGLAILELACSEYFLSRFKVLGYMHQSNPDFVKAIVVEGCGVQYVDRHKFNKVVSQEADLDKNSLHLVGGGSLAAFSACFAKQLLEKPEYLPQKLITVGRNYSPSNSKFPGLLGCRQSTVVDVFIVHECNPVQEMQLLDEILLTLIQSYIELGLHFKVIQYSAQHLDSHEAAAVGVHIFSVSTGKYHEVGRISLCSDYISKRLWTLCKSSGRPASFLSMIHVRTCHVARLLGLLMENQQQEDGTYNIPACLKSIMNIF